MTTLLEDLTNRIYGSLLWSHSRPEFLAVDAMTMAESLVDYVENTVIPHYVQRGQRIPFNVEILATDIVESLTELEIAELFERIKGQVTEPASKIRHISVIADTQYRKHG